MIFFGKFAMGAGGVLVVGMGLLCSEGFVQVDVREKQPETHHVFVIAPAVLAPIGVRCVPAEKLQDAAAQVRPWLPVIRAATSSLRDEKDMTLVEVSDSNQHVRVKKDGGDIVIDVNDENDTVHVSVPLRAIQSTMDELSAVGEPSGKS